jgi:hypothetical protein
MKHHASLWTVAMALVVACTALCAQSTSGFVSIFDGTLKGWAVTNSQTSNFHAVEGVLRVEGPNGWLRSERQYQNFTLRLEFRFVTPDADSGIFLRTTGETQFMRGWPNNSYQVQVRNPVTPSRFPPVGALIRHGMATGETTFNEATVTRVVEATGAWQNLEIDAIGDRLVARLNNTEVLRAGGIAATRGFIGIQGEAGVVEYRRIAIREAQ